jgi:hypothetical protein
MQQIDVQSSATCTVSQPPQILEGGEIGETVTATLTMADTLKNIKHDTISFKTESPEQSPGDRRQQASAKAGGLAGGATTQTFGKR